MKTIAAVLLLAVSAFATTVTDTIKLSNGSTFTGSVFVKGPMVNAITGGTFATPTGTVVTEGFAIGVINGAFSLALAPTDTMTPSGAYYLVTYRPQNAAAWTERWVVATSASPVLITAVRVATVPTPGLVIQPAQIAQAGATVGQALLWGGQAWRPGTVSGGTGGSSAWGGITGTLSDQSDLQDALNAKAPSAHEHSGIYAALSHVHLIGDVTDLQSTLDGKAASGHNHNSAYAALSHVHLIADITGLQTALDGKAAASHNHTGVYEPAISTGLATQCWKGDKTWGSCSTAGGGDVFGPASSVSGRFASFSDTTGKTLADSGYSAASFAAAAHNHDSAYAALVHGHPIAEIGGLQGALDGKSATSHDHAGTYEPTDATILKQANLAGSGVAATPARSDHAHSGVYEPANANIQTHVGSTANPHSTTAAQVGAPALVNPSVADNFVAFSGATGAQKDSGVNAASFATAGHNHNGTYQDADADLTALAGLATTNASIPMGNGSTWALIAIPDCSNVTTGKLLFNSSTRTFSCGTDQTGGSSSTRDVSVAKIEDDFMTGSTASTVIGRLAWSTTNGTPSIVNAEAGHPGIHRRSTGTTNNTVSTLFTPNAVASATHSDDTFDTSAIIRVNQADAHTQVRFGLGSNTTPSNGIYFERLQADTNWFAVVNGSSADSRLDMGTAMGTSWVTLRIRRVNSTTIGFSINGGTEKCITSAASGCDLNNSTNIPSEAMLSLVQLKNGTDAAAKTLDVDYFDLVITGITR